MPEPPNLPPIATEPLSVLLLARNEEPHLEAVLANWVAELGRRERDYEILVVDDGSTDRTAELVEALTARSPQVRLLRHEKRQSAGAALRTGLAAARFPLLLTCTCDGQFQPEDLQRLLADIDKVHLVAGYRVSRPVPLSLRVLGWLYRLFLRVALAHPVEPLPGWLGWHAWRAHVRARVLFGLRVRDVYCPFRLYRREVFERIPIQSDGPFAQVEVLAKANFLGRVMTETPVRHQPPPAETPAEAAAARRQERADFWRVFGHPEFRPPPSEEAAASPAPVPDAPAPASEGQAPAEPTEHG
jgi:glycosyltransferase involved in cell wall biosynthesis